MDSKNNPLGKRVAKTTKGRRILKKREAQVTEPAKHALIMRGKKTKEDMTQLLKELLDIKKPFAQSFLRKHDYQPFEDHKRVCELATKNDATLFAYGSSTKKRPGALILGRCFNGDLLDMYEFKMTDFLSMKSFPVEKPVLGSKPMLVFQGAAFDGKLAEMKSILMDFFRGAAPEKISLAHLEHVIILTAMGEEDDAQILFRQYRVGFSKTGTQLPYCNLKEMGPRFNLGIDRTRPADPAIMNIAMKIPKEATARKIKNIDTTALGKTRGRIHLGRQQFDDIHTPHRGFSEQMDKKHRKGAFKKDEKME